MAEPWHHTAVWHCHRRAERVAGRTGFHSKKKPTSNGAGCVLEVKGNLPMKHLDEVSPCFNWEVSIAGLLFLLAAAVYSLHAFVTSNFSRDLQFE